MENKPHYLTPATQVEYLATGHAPPPPSTVPRVSLEGSSNYKSRSLQSLDISRTADELRQTTDAHSVLGWTRRDRHSLEMLESRPT